MMFVNNYENFLVQSKTIFSSLDLDLVYLQQSPLHFLSLTFTESVIKICTWPHYRKLNPYKLPEIPRNLWTRKQFTHQSFCYETKAWKQILRTTLIPDVTIWVWIGRWQYYVSPYSVTKLVSWQVKYFFSLISVINHSQIDCILNYYKKKNNNFQKRSYITWVQ